MTIRALIEAVERGDAKTDDFFGSYRLEMRNAYLGFLDAAKVLHEALVPGWAWSLGTKYSGGYDAAVMRRRDDAAVIVRDGQADTPARAWLLADLRAVEAEGQP